MARRLGNLIGFLAAAFVLWAVTASEPLRVIVSACLLAGIVFAHWWTTRSRERRRLLDDCHHQHAALMLNDHAYGDHGRYPVGPLEPPRWDYADGSFEWRLTGWVYRDVAGSCYPTGFQSIN